MSDSPASHAERIAFHENALSLHASSLPDSARIAHEVKLAELRAVDPFAVERREIEDQLARPINGPERAVLEAALRTVKRAQGDYAGAQLLRKSLPQPARVFWSGVHRSATTGPDVSPTDAAHEYIREHGTIGLAESGPALNTEEGILADIAGKPLAHAVAPQVIDPDRLRRLHDVRAFADEGDRLRVLADDLPRADAEEALNLLELQEADDTGTLHFGLSERERAAAELLRRDREHSRLLAETVAEVRATAAAKRMKLAERTQLAEPSRQLNLAETSPPYEQRDSHGVLLTCIDSKSPFINRHI